MPYSYNAKLVRIIDGDTMEFEVDLGFSIYSRHHVRLAGVNAPELKTAAGRDAAVYTKEWFDTNHAWDNTLLTTIKGLEFEKYGRYLAFVHSAITGAQLNTDIVESGHAVTLKY